MCVSQGHNPLAHIQSGKRNLQRGHRTAELGVCRIQLCFSLFPVDCCDPSWAFCREKQTTDAPKLTGVMGSLGLKTSSVQDLHVASVSDSAPGHQTDIRFVLFIALCQKICPFMCPYSVLNINVSYKFWDGPLVSNYQWTSTVSGQVSFYF